MELLENNFAHIFQPEMEFGSNALEVIDSLKRMNDTLSLKYISTLSDSLLKRHVDMTIIAAFTFLSIPANILTLLTVMRNNHLWTASNAVLCINGLVQAVGGVIYLIIRSLWFYCLLFLPSNNSYKESIYLVGWWACSIMVRTGNNR